MDEDDDLSHTEFPNACSLVGIELDKVPRRLALWIVDWIVDWIGHWWIMHRHPPMAARRPDANPPNTFTPIPSKLHPDPSPSSNVHRRDANPWLMPHHGALIPPHHGLADSSTHGGARVPFPGGR